MESVLQNTGRENRDITSLLERMNILSYRALHFDMVVRANEVDREENKKRVASSVSKAREVVQDLRAQLQALQMHQQYNKLEAQITSRKLLKSRDEQYILHKRLDLEILHLHNERTRLKRRCDHMRSRFGNIMERCGRLLPN
jgi:hypothetical protein